MRLFFVIYVVSIIAGIVALITYKRKITRRANQTTGQIIFNQQANKKNNLFILYKIYRCTPFLSRKFEAVRKKVEILYPADIISINISSTKIMSKNLLKGIFVAAFVIIFGKGDLFYLTAGLLGSYILFNNGIEDSFYTMDKKLVYQFRKFSRQLRKSYHKRPIIEDAIYNTIDEIDYEISVHILHMYNLITSSNIDEKLSGYIDIIPNKFMMQFMAIATSIRKNGNGETEDGKNIFLTSLSHLEKEMDNQILIIEDKERRFKGKVFATLLPIFLIKGFQWWVKTFFSDVSSFFLSPIGKGIMIGIFVITFICYNLIMDLKSNQKGREIKSSIFMKLADFPIIKELLTSEINRHYTYYMRINDSLRITGDKTGPHAFLLKSIILGIVTFFTSVILIFSGTLVSKYDTLNNVVGSYDDVVVPNESYITIMEETNIVMNTRYKSIHITDANREQIREEMMEEIRTTTKLGGDTYAEKVVETTMKNLEKFQNTYFKWWYLIICFSLSIFAFMGPRLYLRFKQNLVNMSQEDEVNQYNALMLTLMNVSGINVDQILEWMERFSYCFKDSIQDCINEIDFGKQKALIKLRNAEGFQGFKDFVDNLISIDDVGVRKAFDEVISEREYFLKKREADSMAENIEKGKLASRISFIPSLIMFLFYMLLPIAMLVINMFTYLNSAMK